MIELLSFACVKMNNDNLTEFNREEFMKYYYQWMGLLALVLCTCLTRLEAKESDAVSYRVTRSDYTFSTVFDMAHDKQPIGSIVKTVFSIRTHYALYNPFGLYEGEAICRFFCMGLFYTWATEIDVYDMEGDKIGMIDGQVVTSEPAKFSFYDANEERVAIGYLDQNCMGFSLVDPDRPNCVLARLTRNFIQDTLDNWDVVIYYPEKIPPKLVQVFAAFVCDTQHKFKPDL